MHYILAGCTALHSPQIGLKMDYLGKEITFYSSYNEKTPHFATFSDWLDIMKANKSGVEKVRQALLPEAKRELAKLLPCALVAGRFFTRSIDGLVYPSYLMEIDIMETQENPIDDWHEELEWFTHRKNALTQSIVYGAVNTADNGLSLVVAIAKPWFFRLQFQSIATQIPGDYRILPAGRCNYHAMVATYDEEAYINDFAIPYTQTNGGFNDLTLDEMPSFGFCRLEQIGVDILPSKRILDILDRIEKLKLPEEDY